MKKQYKPINILQKVKIGFDLKSKQYGEINIGLVECDDEGYRLYMSQAGESQCEKWAASYKEALQIVTEIAYAMNAKMIVAITKHIN